MDLKKKALTGSIWKLAERLLAQGISLLVTVILARLLVPDDYGIVGMVTIFFTFANVLISGGLNTALIQKKDADEEDYSTVFTVSFLVGVALYIVLFACAPLIAKMYGKPQLILITRIMGLSLPVYAIKSIVCAYTSATLQFRKFFFATLGGTLTSGVIGICMALSGWGPWSIVAQQMTNTIIDTLILFTVTKIKVRFYISPERFKNLAEYGWKILLSSLLGTIYTQINPMVIGIRFTMADLSFYTKGSSFVDMLSSSIIYTLSSVLFPVLAQVQNSKEKLLAGTRRYMQLASFVLFPVMFGFFAVSDQFILLLLTEKWLPAAYYIKIFCLSSVTDIIAAGNCETIKAMGRSDIFLKMEIIKKTLYFLVLALFIACTDSPRALAISAIITAIIAVVVNMIPNISLLGYTVKMQLKDIGTNLLGSVLMCIVVLLVGKLSMGTFSVFVIQIVTGAIFYILFNVIIRNENLNYCWKSAKAILDIH